MRIIRRHRPAHRFLRDISLHTPFVRMVLLQIVSWLVFAAALNLCEGGMEGSPLATYGDALYWAVAAFSTAGIADMPLTGPAKFIGGVWIVFGSMLFFGTIVATVTAYFTRPMQRPHRRIIDTIEYNLEQVGDLSIEELDLLRDTVDALIEHVERIKQARAAG